MSRLVRRLGKRVDVTGERWTGYDGQGNDTYAAGTAFEALAQEMRELVRTKDGDEVTLTLALWVAPDADFIPDRKDRLTYDGRTYIVLQRRTVRGLRNSAVTHYRVECIDE